MQGLFRECGVRVIACNDGYLLGWPDVCFFGDWGWWEIHHRTVEFANYSGLKISCEKDCRGKDGILVLERRPCSFQMVPHRIGWYGNTGISAINLAAKLGASGVVLLGFDMSLDETGSSNWYTKLKDPVPNPEWYPRFMRWSVKFKADMEKACPGLRVINATPGTKMNTFEKMPLKGALEVLCG